MKKGLCFALLAMFLPVLAWAQLTFSGKVLDARTQAGLAGASVSLSTKIQRASDKNGGFSFTGLAAGNYVLKVRFVGYQAIEKTIVLPADGQVELFLKPSIFPGDEVVIKATRATEQSATTYTNLSKAVLEKNNTVSVQTTVMNNAIVPIPLVDGWHPYFTLGESIDNCSLQFLSKGKMEYDSNLLPTGNMIADDRFSKGLKLGSIQLDDGYELAADNRSCTLQNEQFTLTINPSSLYPYLQLYTPPDRKSIAIENLSGAPNAFNNKIGLHIVKPQEDIVFETSYQVVLK